MASVIYSLGTDKTLILDTRAPFLQAFKATNWTDLRLSIMLSVTKQSDPNDPTSLGETIGAGEDSNQVYIGFKSSDGLLPPSSNFFGFSTQKATPDGTSTSLFDNAQFVNQYNFQRNLAASCYLYASNGTTKLQGTGSAASFPLVDTVTADYATLIILQMLRNDPTLNVVDALAVAVGGGTIPWTGANYADTSVGNIRTLTAAATYQIVGGPFTFNPVPDALYVFWPFTLSRLRLHAYCLEKYG